MATETIHKLQPNRTLHLRGFDRFGAAAALHSTSETGFTVSGVWRDMADFAVLILWDADDYFDHWQTTKYLPDFDFTGMLLTFDVSTTGVQPLDSHMYRWIAWRDLSYIKADGTSGTIDLADHITQNGGTWTKASAAFTFSGSLSPYIHLTLWYLNIAFDWWGDGSTTPTVADILNSLASQINAYDYSGVTMGLTATVSGSDLIVTAARAGADGNSIRLYSITNGPTLTDSTNNGWLVGGTSAATWRVTLDFSTLGLTSLRQAWLTFAPQLPVSGAYADTEFAVTVTNWSVTDPSGVRALKIAGPGSVRISGRDAWVAYTGSGWSEEIGYYHGGFARRMSASGDMVTVKYSCQQAHSLYVGTSLYSDRGIVSISLDGGTASNLDAYLAVDSAVVTRRKISQSVAAGEHTVTITYTGAKNASSTGTYFYFDYLEAAVPSDVSDASVTYSAAMPATDFDTDHGYKLSPQRLVWMLDRLGFQGDLDHYLGVFWWNQRKRSGGTFPVKTVTFGGTWAWNASNPDSAFLTIGGTTIGKTVYPQDTTDSIALHFAYFINETLIGVRASASGSVLTITGLTPTWSFTYSSTKSSSAGTITESGSLDSGVEGEWVIDSSVSPVLNRAVSDGHGDFFAAIQAKGWTVTAALSMELVNPPDNPPSAVWTQRFADGTAVETDTGFSSLKSTQCTFSATFRAYQQQAYKEVAGLMATAGLTPWLQYGEFLWWFFPGSSPTDTKGMAFYDADTAAAAETALGRALATFTSSTDDPSVNSYADANFLRQRIKDHTDAIAAFVTAAYTGTKFELLWPYDVNYPTVTAISKNGGQLNRYVNMPSGFQAKSGSGLDRLKMEALSFGASERDFGKAKETIRFPYTSPMSWAKSDWSHGSTAGVRGRWSTCLPR